MITLPGVTCHCKIYESSASLVYRGIRVQDDRAIVIKMLKQDYPSPQELTHYRQEYEITRSSNTQTHHRYSHNADAVGRINS